MYFIEYHIELTNLFKFNIFMYYHIDLVIQSDSRSNKLKTIKYTAIIYHIGKNNFAI